nr:Uncharacterised protein [Klebsiella pneumoniae]
MATEPGSQYQQQAEAGDRRAQYYLADTGSAPAIIKSRILGAEGGRQAMAMRWRCWRSSKSVTPTGGLSAGPPAGGKAVEAGSKSGEIVLARVLVNRQAGATDVAHAITLLQDAARIAKAMRR